ncbi:SDR family NAD(P)-dependent oxidoreductase [Sphingomonas crocodyli]|uniref:SDR family NAD(P)-dependent oxidoreductase n=1 Tax=Sphingomonas crocodyli TaxID=1979270 RepID=A0A437MA25_9SPHN|nr:SDR family NAD(P)-dependent oxidoreductase [Sphingomonas crocodyli]RVT94484.1 SDR family NAD(P)-dependent oxidoreductase [Sphingomonas crocodyli]
MRDYRERYGEWALILGASQGLGRAIAAEAARRKLNLVMVARREAPLIEAAREIEAELGIQTKTLAMDMARDDIVDAIEAGLGGIDIAFMVYNAAAEPHGEFLEQDVATHLENIAVNCTTPTLLVHHFGRKMVARGRGGIVICSSLAADQGIYSYVTYGAAKAYEMILGEGLWEELRHHGVDATALMVGSTYTPNFRESQRKKGTLFADSPAPEGIAEGIPLPQLPEDAAASLFAQIDGEWLPRIFANPRDEQNAIANRDKSRVEMIMRMGDAMRTGWRKPMDPVG